MTEIERLTLAERPTQAPEQAPGAASMPTHVVRPLDLVLWAREAQRCARLRSGHAVTDNRHPATGNDPGRGSATTEKP